MLVRSRSYNKAREVRTLRAAEVRELLCQKAHEHFRDMARAFCTLDRSGRGRVTRGSLRELLRTFEMDMEAAEFEALWAALDTHDVGHVSYEALLENLGACCTPESRHTRTSLLCSCSCSRVHVHAGIAAQFSPGDMEGTSRTIVKNNLDALQKHLENQKARAHCPLPNARNALHPRSLDAACAREHSISQQSLFINHVITSYQSLFSVLTVEAGEAHQESGAHRREVHCRRSAQAPSVPHSCSPL